jgi:hypothetical protein
MAEEMHAFNAALKSLRRAAFQAFLSAPRK